VKNYRISMLMQQYEMFTMNKDESINSMSARFSNIVNELTNLGRECKTEDKVQKILQSLDERRQPKVTAIEQAKDLTTLSFQDLIGSLMAHELSLNRSRPTKSKNKGIALKTVLAEEEEERFDEDMGLFVRRFNKSFNMNPSKPQFNKNVKKFRPKSENRGCFKCGGSDHMIKDCPTWKNIKSAEKREKTKQDYKQAMLASCGWGDIEISMDSDTEEEEEEPELKANVCLTSHETRRSKIKKASCFMANPVESESDSDEEENQVSFNVLKAQMSKWSKNKFIEFIEQIHRTGEERENSLNEMHKQILEIAEENHHLKEKVTKLRRKKTVQDTVNITTPVVNMPPSVVNITTEEDNITTPVVNITKKENLEILELRNKIKSLIELNVSLSTEVTKKTQELTEVEYSYHKKISELQGMLNQPKDNCASCETMKDLVDKMTQELDELQEELDKPKEKEKCQECDRLKEKLKTPSITKNCDNCGKLEKEKLDLDARLKEALSVSKKWKASENVLKFLNEQTERFHKEGLGYQTKRRIEYCKNNNKPSDRDFRKRKYVGLPEYIICYYCGKSGHVQYGCEKRINYEKRNTEHVKNKRYDSSPKRETHHEKPTVKQNQNKPIHKLMKQIWVRKDSLPNVINKKGPNVRWVPKTQK